MSLANSLATPAEFRLQWTIIYAILMRDIKMRYAKTRLGFLMAIIDPLITMSMMVGIRLLMSGLSTRHGISILTLVLSGYLVFFAVRSAMMSISGATQQTSVVMIFPRVTILDAILARCLMTWFSYTCVLITLSVMGVFIFGIDPPLNPALAIFCISLGMIMGCAAGIVLGVAIRYVPAIQYLLGLIIRLMTIISGAMFTADELPARLLPYLSWNPIFHLCELMRTAWIPSYVSPIANIWYVMACILFLTCAALIGERASRHFKFT